MIAMRQVQIVRWQLGNASFQPMRAQLSEGFMAAPDISSGAVSVLQSAVDKIIELLSRETEALTVEADLVSPAAIRAEPSAASDISFIGNLPPQEIRSAIGVAGRELGSRATRVVTGALAPYLTSDQVSRLSSEKYRAGQVVALIQNQDTLPLSQESQTSVESYLAMHFRELDGAVIDAEKAVVEAEAGSVPVLEPSEKSLATNIAIGVSLAAVTGFVLWQLLG